jgi:hypothetical protein
MAILWMDGFDLYDSLTDAATSGWSVATAGTNTPAVNKTAGRTGGSAFDLHDNNSRLQFALPVVQALSEVRVYSIALKFITVFIASGTSGILELWELDSSRAALGIRVASGGGVSLVSAWNNGDTITTDFSFVLDTWYRVDLKVTAPSVAGSSTSRTSAVELYVDGNLIGSGDMHLSWQTGQVGYVRLGGSTVNGHTYFDDLVVSNDTGSVNTGILGDVIIETLRPDGDGSAQDWTANTGTASGAIDDSNGSSDGDSTYISSSVVGDKSEFSLTDLPDLSASILGVQTSVKSKKTDSGDRTIRSYLLSGSSVANDASFGPATSYTWNRNAVVELNPDGGAAWSDSTVNALEVGLETVT